MDANRGIVETQLENVRYFTHRDYPPDGNTRTILEKMARVEGVVKPVVALPDLHYKYSYHTPTGVVVLTRDRIIPKFVNANCGMSFVKTPFFADEVDDKKLDTLFDHLRKNITISTRMEPVISRDDLEEIVMKGAEWTFEKFGLDGRDLANFENEGSLFKYDTRSAEKIMSYVPRACRDVGLLSLGVLGYGNHFIELQAVDSVLNGEIAEKFGISENQLCFMIHSDSRAFGQSLIDHYSKKTKRLLGLQQAYKKIHYMALASQRVPRPVKRAFDRLNFYLNRFKSTAYWKMDALNRKADIDFKTMGAGTEEAEGYLASTYAAINFGYANRAYMASVIRDAFNRAFGREDTQVNILHDGNHDALQQERIGGEIYYVHRNGANRALPPECFPDHPVFSRTGQPVLLPSSLGRPSFLCAAAKGCPASYFSTCHGVGRVIDRGEAREKFSADEVFDEARSASMKIYDYGKGKAQEEAPRAFKDVNKVLETLAENEIAEPVARLRPLAVLKGWR